LELISSSLLVAHTLKKNHIILQNVNNIMYNMLIW
jgi:hypothetical protein